MKQKVRKLKPGTSLSNAKGSNSYNFDSDKPPFRVFTKLSREIKNYEKPVSNAKSKEKSVVSVPKNDRKTSPITNDISKYLFQLTNASLNNKDYVYKKYQHVNENNPTEANQINSNIFKTNYSRNKSTINNQKTTLNSFFQQNQNSNNVVKLNFENLNKTSLSGFFSSIMNRTSTPNKFKSKFTHNQPISAIPEIIPINVNNVNYNTNQFNYFDKETLYEENLKLKKLNNNLQSQTKALTIAVNKAKIDVKAKQDIIMELTANKFSINNNNSDISKIVNKSISKNNEKVSLFSEVNNNKVGTILLIQKNKDRINELEEEKIKLEDQLKKIKQQNKSIRLKELTIENKLFEEQLKAIKNLLVEKTNENNDLKNIVKEFYDNTNIIIDQKKTIKALEENELKLKNDLEELQIKYQESLGIINKFQIGKLNTISPNNKDKIDIKQSGNKDSISKINNFDFFVDNCFLLCEEMKKKVDDIVIDFESFVKTYKINENPIIKSPTNNLTHISSPNNKNVTDLDNMFSLTTTQTLKHHFQELFDLISKQQLELQDKILIKDRFYSINTLKNSNKQLSLIQKAYKETRKLKIKIFLLESKEQSYLIDNINKIIERSDLIYSRLKNDNHINVNSQSINNASSYTTEDKILFDINELIYIYMKNFEVVNNDTVDFFNHLSNHSLHFENPSTPLSNEERKHYNKDLASKLIFFISLQEDVSFLNTTYEFIESILWKTTLLFGEIKVVNIIYEIFKDAIFYNLREKEFKNIFSNIISKLSSKYKQFNDIISILDANNHGMITFTEMKILLSELNIEVNEEEIEFLIYFMKKDAYSRISTQINSKTYKRIFLKDICYLSLLNKIKDHHLANNISENAKDIKEDDNNKDVLVNINLNKMNKFEVENNKTSIYDHCINISDYLESYIVFNYNKSISHKISLTSSVDNLDYLDKYIKDLFKDIVIEENLNEEDNDELNETNKNKIQYCELYQLINKIYFLTEISTKFSKSQIESFFDQFKPHSDEFLLVSTSEKIIDYDIFIYDLKIKIQKILDEHKKGDNNKKEDTEELDDEYYKYDEDDLIKDNSPKNIKKIESSNNLIENVEINNSKYKQDEVDFGVLDENSEILSTVNQIKKETQSSYKNIDNQNYIFDDKEMNDKNDMLSYNSNRNIETDDIKSNNNKIIDKNAVSDDMFKQTLNNFKINKSNNFSKKSDDDKQSKSNMLNTPCQESFDIEYGEL